MSSGSRLSDVLSTINSLPRRSSAGESLRSVITTRSKRKQKATSTYHPYSVYDQTMSPPILRDSEALRKLLEAIYESPGGRRSLSRLARTCRALCEPALAILWRELDSLIPILGLFPADMLRKARKPGLGLSRTPREDEWTKVLRYGELVRRLAYDETLNNVSPSVFPILQEHRPHAYILPNLQQLVWKVETAPALDRSKIFLSPALEGLVLEVGPHTNQIDAFIADISSRLKLKQFSFVSPTSLPNSFAELLLPRDTLERLVLEAPGALSPGVGRWVASLSRLRSFHIDLTGRSVIAVEGFFDEIHPRSGDSTPSSVGTTDSGVFSGEEVDFSDIRKAALRLTGDLGSKGSFGQLRHLNLSGDVSNIAVFLKHIPSPLTQLDLVIDDPPDRNDWQDLSSMLSDKFGHSLQSLRVTATRFSDSLRPKGDGHLPLQHFGSLPLLYRLEIDLPESILFTAEDITNLASTCPNLEELKLSPLARFALSGRPPKLYLESLAPLMTNCRRLHTLAVVINARGGSPEILSSMTTSSDSLLRLHVGHSWINDPLHVTILLSHLCPRLETLKWFHEKNRPGFIEAHARGWEKVLDALPHLQNVRLTERLSAPRAVEYVYIPEKIVLPETAEKSIDATVIAIEKGVLVRPRTAHGAVQASPVLVGCGIDARPRLASVSVAASPEYAEQQIDASVSVTNHSVDARPQTTVAYIDATEPEHVKRPLFRPFALQTIITLFTLPWKALIFPFTLSSSIFRKIFSSIHWPKRSNGTAPAEQSMIPMNDMPAYAQSTTQNMQSMPMVETHVRP